MTAGPVQTDLRERLLGGEKRALARAISLIENGDPAGAKLVAELYPRTGSARIMGFTGPPGVGKSTIIGALIGELRARDRRVAVLSIDPSSPFTRGALLGDRIRLSEHFLDEGVFIRSMASRGALGGLAEAALQSALVMDAAGFDDVLLETVGVGQAEIDVVDHADTVVLALMPGSGDSIQALKAGVMEIPDVIVVNKAEHPLTDTMVREVRTALSLGPTGRLEGPDHQDGRLRGHGDRGAAGGGRGPSRSTSRSRERSTSAAPATCAARSSASPPPGCAVSSSCGSPRMTPWPHCSTPSSGARPIPPRPPPSCSGGARSRMKMADRAEPRPAGGSGFDLADARRCLGAKVDEVNGGGVGRVQGLLVDAADGSPTWLIVKLGRIGRRAAVPARFVVAGSGKAWAAFPRSWIRGAAEIDPARGLTPTEERQLAAHYGMPLDAGRPATLSERAFDELSSVPDS